MTVFAKKNLQQKFILGIFQRDFRKCSLKKTLESVENFLLSISIPTTMHLSRSIQACILFLPEHICRTKALHLGFRKKLTTGSI